MFNNLKRKKSVASKLTKVRCTILLSTLSFFSIDAAGQQAANDGTLFSKKIYTAFPFLLINADARTGGMGDIGVALPDDKNSMANNPAKIVSLEENGGISLSYSPYLKSLASGISLAYLSGHFRVGEKGAIGAGLKYLSFGKVEITNANMQRLGTFNPSEAAFDISYAQSFGEDFSLALTTRYITSASDYNPNSANTGNRVNNGFAADVSAFWKIRSNLFGKEGLISLGLNITNIGPKVSYSEAVKAFLPTNLRLGSSFSIPVEELNRLTISVDLNKLMVPSITEFDAEAPSVPSAIFSSFTDAPGGFSEEISEWSVSTGIEYTFTNVLALRTGYFYESPQKGYRRYLTLGTGLKLKKMDIDLAYIAANPQSNPLANTLRFSLALKI